MTYRAVAFTSRGQAGLVSVEGPGPLGEGQVRGRTLYTLISPGTELAWGYRGDRYKGKATYPIYPGYASVAKVEEVGPEVDGIRPGDLVFCKGRHQSVQQFDADQVIPVPRGLSPQMAPLARLMGVTMTTLITTAARPGDRVMVTGVGPVGYLGAQVFRAAGYEVLVVEPHDGRREAAARSGVAAVYPRVPVDDPDIVDAIALVAECSGDEQAVLDACRVVRKRGEVALVGVPWVRQTDISAHEVLAEVFHRYVVLRSGWEWEIPLHGEAFRPHNIFGNWTAALRWLAQGKIDVTGLMRTVSPHDAQAAYESLLDKTAAEMFTLFDWSLV